MNTPYVRLSGLITLVAIVIGCAANRLVAQSPAVEKSPVVIALVAEAMIDDSLVQLDQIAKLTGGTAEMRRRIAKLDVAELKLSAERTTVTADQVRFRLLLAGLESSQVRLTGFKQTLVYESNEPVTLRKILNSADKALRQKLGGDPSKVSIVPAKEIIAPRIDVLSNDRIQLDAKVNPASVRADKARVDVAVIINGRAHEIIPVHLEFKMSDPIVKGSPKNFNILPTNGLVVRDEPSDILVKNTDLVKIVARIGSARIEAAGVAMQDGKLGDVIRVRNTDSNRVVLGRVEPNGTVLVGY